MSRSHTLQILNKSNQGSSKNWLIPRAEVGEMQDVPGTSLVPENKEVLRKGALY